MSRLFPISNFKETARQKQNAMRLGVQFVNKVDEDMTEILESISFIHSWIRNQALFRTTTMVNIFCVKIIVQNQYICIKEEYDNEEDVVIRLTGSDPQKCRNIVRFNYTTGTFENVQLK